MIKLHQLLLFFTTFYPMLLKSMEDRIQQTSVVQGSIQQSLVDRSVTLELFHGDKHIDALNIPCRFAQKFSVLWDNVMFQEMKDEELCIPLIFPDITSDYLRILKVFSKKYYKRESIKQSIAELRDIWYSRNSLNQFVDLAILSNYLGNDESVRYGVKALYNVLQKLTEKQSWPNFLSLLSF
jgi:hypothetical protein